MPTQNHGHHERMACHDLRAEQSLSAFAGDFASPSAQPHHAPDLPLEPAHIDVDLRIDVDAKSAAGTVTITAVGRRRDARSLVLDAVDFLDLAVEDPDGGDLDFDYDGRKLTLTWATPADPGEQRRAAISYRVHEPLDGLKFSTPDAACPDKVRWAGTDHETERARYWLPCVDHPIVRTGFDWHLRAEAGFTILAGGALRSEDKHDDGTKTAHWRLEQPCPAYLACFVVGDLVRVEGGSHEGKPIAFFTERGASESDLARAFEKTEAMLGWISEKLGTPFPYPKYFQFVLPGIGGAMENISLVSWDDFCLMDDPAWSERGWVVDIINLHEMAHTWFGDLVVCRDFSQVWLKESWATYMESVWLEDQEGEEAMQVQLLDEERLYRAEADGRYARPIETRAFDSSWDMFDLHLYPGGAVRLHMLRKRIGDEAFWEGVREYVATFAGRTVETDDFRRILEHHSGLSLTRFFEEWFRSPGYPQLKASGKHDKDAGLYTVSIEQKQAEGGGPVGLFQLPLTVAIRVEGEWERRTVRLEEARHELVFATPAKPDAVVFDPDFEAIFALEFDPGVPELTAAMNEGPTPRARAQGAAMLGANGSRLAVDALREAGLNPETPWWLRLEVFRALGKADTHRAYGALAELLEHEQHPRILWVLADLCGAIRDPRLEAALVLRLDGELPPMARGAALRSLGKQRGEAHLDRLRAGLHDDSFWGIVRRGALEGLAETRAKEALPAIESKLAYGADVSQVRAMAVSALADAARHQDEPTRARAVEAVASLVRDPELRVRQAVPGALQVLRAVEAVGSLDTLVRHSPVQEEGRIRRAQASLRANGGRNGGPVEKLGKQLEELRAENRKLRDRLEKIEARLGVDE